MAPNHELVELMRREGRSAIATAIYRWTLGLLFLLATISEFPAHRWPIALAFLVMSQGFNSLSGQLSLQGAAEALRLDLGERKTRITVAVAQRWGVKGAEYDPWTFWDEVNREVDSELGPPLKSTPWAGVGGVLFSLAANIVADVIGIAIVFGLSPSS